MSNSPSNAFCRSCGSQLRTGAGFCNNCGNPVSAVQAPTPYAEPVHASAKASAKAASRGGSVLGRVAAGLIVAAILVVIALLVAYFLVPGPRQCVDSWLQAMDNGDINAAIALSDPQTQNAYATAKKVADGVMGLVGKAVGVDIPIGVSDILDNAPLFTQLIKSSGAGQLPSGKLIEPVTVKSNWQYAVVYGAFDYNRTNGVDAPKLEHDQMFFPLKRYGLQWKVVLLDQSALQGVRAAFPEEFDRYYTPPTGQ